MASLARELLLIGVTSAIGAGAVINSPKEPSSELSASAPRFMGQIKTPPEENRKSQEDEISQLEKILRRAQEDKASSDLDVLQYEVPLSPLATKFESNLGKVHPEAFKGALKSYDRKESRHTPHPTLAAVNFSQESQDSKSIDGKPVRTPNYEKTKKVSEKDPGLHIVQKPADKVKEPLETFSTLSRTESIAPEISAARPQFFRHSPTSSIKPEFKYAQTLDLPRPFRATAASIFIFSTYQSLEKLVFHGRKRSASSAMSPTFFESRHPQKRARMTRQTLYLGASTTQPNYFTSITPSQFNTHFLSKATANPITITYSPQPQKIKLGYTLTDLDWIEFDIFHYEISRKVETSEGITQEEINNSTTAEATSYAVFETSEPMQPTGFTIASNPLNTSMGVYTVSNKVPYQGQSRVLHGPKKSDTPTPKEVHFENVIETPIDSPKPVIYTTSPSPFMTSWRISIVNPGAISHQAKKGFIDDSQIQTTSTHSIQHSLSSVRKNSGTAPALNISVPAVLGASNLSEDVSVHAISILEKAKIEAQKRLQEYKSRDLFIQSLDENYIKTIQGFINKKKRERKRVKSNIKRLQEEVISTLGILIDDAESMISSISKISGWEAIWQEEWNSLNQKITDIFNSVSRINEEFARIKEELKSKLYKVQTQLGSIPEAQNNIFQELEIIKQDIRSEEELNIIETTLDFAKNGKLDLQAIGREECELVALLENHSNAPKREQKLKEDLLRLDAQEKSFKDEEVTLNEAIEKLEINLSDQLQQQKHERQELIKNQKKLESRIKRLKKFTEAVQPALSTIQSAFSSLNSISAKDEGNIPNTSDLLTSTDQIITVMSTSKEAKLLKRLAPESWKKAIDSFTTAKDNLTLLEDASKMKDAQQKKQTRIQRSLTSMKAELSNYRTYQKELEEDCQQKQIAESTLLKSIREILGEIKSHDEWQEIPSDIESRIQLIISVCSPLKKKISSEYKLKMTKLEKNILNRRSLAPTLKSLDEIEAF